MTDRHVCIHGHFYQPPRENPWLEQVEYQESAYPYHDWNERVTAECYAPNTASRILDGERKIIDIVNNYSKISFNFGPTLLSWLEKYQPDIHWGILEADKKSKERFSGHGSALAQCYNHMIMPLANSRDKKTQIIWGIRDFEHRFQRKPEGMWLPETAADLETLDMLAEQEIRFTILAPRQAKRIRKIDDKRWRDVSNSRIDPKRPYLLKLASGRSIVLFFYDGPISQDVAFSPVLKSGEILAKRIESGLTDAKDGSQLMHIATDGETYGHHHRFADMALAYCLYYIESKNIARITIYAEYLEKNPPQYEVEIFENSSWSCVHGVERWRSNCGCNSGMKPGWQQEWRSPLRGALDWLRDNASVIYEEQITPLINDPWHVRDQYIHVILNRSPDTTAWLLKENSKRELLKDDTIKILKLLEMQHHAMLMFTSCGWFFDEISGIETIQVLQYAARVLQLIEEVSGISLEDAFKNLLERSPSNVPEFKHGALIYDMFVKPTILDLLRVGAHYAVSSIFKEYTKESDIYTYSVSSRYFHKEEIGRQKLGIGSVRVLSRISGDEKEISFAVLHLGDHTIIGGAREFMGDDKFSEMEKTIKELFAKGETSEVIRVIDKHFVNHSYSLWHLFKDEQKEIMDQIFKETRKEIDASFRNIYQNYYPVMQAVSTLRLILPEYFAYVLEYVYNTDIQRLLKDPHIDYDKLEQLLSNSQQWHINLNREIIDYLASKRINDLMDQWLNSPEDIETLKHIVRIMTMLNSFVSEYRLWRAQNIYFFTAKKLISAMKEKQNSNDPASQQWLALFQELGGYLKIKI